MAGTIWRRRARSRGFRNFRRKTGSARGRPFKPPRARKRKAGRPDSWQARKSPARSGYSNAIPIKSERTGRSVMGLAVDTKSFECTIDDGLAHIVLNQPDRGNPIDGDF